MKYADKLQLGDTVFHASGSAIYLGFFAGYGRGTFQFYTPAGIVGSKERCEKKGETFTIKKLWKCYIKADGWRIAKVNNPVFGDNEEREEYEKAREILIDLKFIKP